MRIVLLSCMVFLTIGCKNQNTKQEVSSPVEFEKKDEITGNYVSEGYHKKEEGYDWVAITITEVANESISVRIRSRADKKKPTCLFDTIAYKLDQQRYRTTVNGKNVIFQFTDKTITIESESKEDEGVLYFYCSAGASIAGTYTKIEEELDENQIDKTQFSKVLNLQNVGFHVSSIVKEGTQLLEVVTFGLPNEYNETFDLENQVVFDAEVEDLNSDGSPELVVYTKENNVLQKGHIYAFSVNNMKSMSQVYFPITQDNSAVNHGYNGHDEFTLVETNLVQRFPIFKENIQTGKMRQVIYKLQNGADMRRFVVVKAEEYDK
ncbi:hypothetical protein [Imtechella halotolerans]|uniref:Lipoprotein n=2 Tax=Imtechella TaxID=1165076 RepID=I0WBW6_9FLAO|nr:hypothetical protein [Imtechella halotolerans]EID73882.1 hypothetical protein W5A_09965 [Imtechella halotolerans K1]